LQNQAQERRTRRSEQLERYHQADRKREPRDHGSSVQDKRLEYEEKASCLSRDLEGGPTDEWEKPSDRPFPQDLIRLAQCDLPRLLMFFRLDVLNDGQLTKILEDSLTVDTAERTATVHDLQPPVSTVNQDMNRTLLVGMREQSSKIP
jgi:hypothetical protein